MNIFGFTWADGGAFVGGALGGAFLGPPGAMLGSAVGSFAGATWGDDKGGGAALEEALVAGIGAAGGAWATNLAGVLLRNGITSAAARTLSAGAAQRVDQVASKALLPWNSHGGGPVAAFGGAFGGYEVSAQARLPVQIDTTDIGNGGCPAQMANLRMPTQLTGPVGDMYRDLPGYLCDVWRSFGTGPQKAPPAPELPAELIGADAGIAEYTAKARQLNTMMAGFAELDARAGELIAGGARRICDEGRAAVGSLIDTVNTRAPETPPTGVSVQSHALDLLNDAFGQGREILSRAVASTDRVAGRVDALAGRLASLREEFESYKGRHADEHRPQPVQPPALPAPPPALPAPPPAPCITLVPPVNATPVQVRAEAGNVQHRDPSTDSGTPVSTPQLPPPRTRPSAGHATVVSGTPTPTPTPWTPQVAADHPVPEPIESRSPEHIPQATDSAAPAPALLGWVVPSFVPAAWYRAPSGPIAPSGPAAAPIPPGHHTPWTGLTTSPTGTAAALSAGPRATPASAAGRARTADDNERKPGIDDSEGRPTDLDPHAVLLDARGHHDLEVFIGHEPAR